MKCTQIVHVVKAWCVHAVVYMQWYTSVKVTGDIQEVEGTQMKWGIHICGGYNEVGYAGGGGYNEVGYTGGGGYTHNVESTHTDSNLI